MATYNALTDRGKKILHMVEAVHHKLANVPEESPLLEAVEELRYAIEMLILSGPDQPLWKKERD